MAPKWLPLLVMVSGLLVLAACMPESGFSRPGAEGQGKPEELGPQDMQSQQGAKSPQGVQPPQGGQPPQGVQSQPGAAPEGLDTPEADATEIGPNIWQPQSCTGVVYVDNTYKFTVAAPAGFVFRVVAADDLAKLKPKPVAAFTYMNPTSAASEEPFEAADLEIRVYDPAGASSLSSWLQSVGLTAGSQPPVPFSNSHVSGVKLCRSTMMMPNCTYFFMGKDWVYQLISMTQPGEEMLRSFTLIQ